MLKRAIFALAAGFSVVAVALFFSGYAVKGAMQCR